MNKKDEKEKAAKYDPTLTTEEKKDARKLTEKEWLYRIGRSNDGMWDQSKKKTAYRWAKRIDGHFDEIGALLSILSIVLTVCGFIFTCVQINQANESYRESARQFQQSGPVFSWFDEDYYASSMSSDGTGRQIGAIVLSNTGRTSGSIIAVKRDGDSGKPMTLCMPSFTEDGRYDKTVKPTVGTGLAALDPGDSRLVFYMTGNGGKLDRTETLRIVTTSGQTFDATRIRNVSKEAMDHYASLEGWFDAVNACEDAMDDMR